MVWAAALERRRHHCWASVEPLIQIKEAGQWLVDHVTMDWQPIDTAPFDRDVELAVINGEGPHALIFPCRRMVGGWINAESKKQLYYMLPTHWRAWIA
jgi:hypothetical protein